MDDGAISLTAGFTAADEATWRALVDKTLGGAPFEKRLVSKTYDGIDIQPLYTAGNSAPPLPEDLRQRPPFDQERPWDIRAIVDHPDPGEANALAMADLEGGATSLLVKVDPTGQDGVAVASQADLERALDGVLFDLAPVALDAGYLGPEAATWLNAIAQAKTLKPHLHLHLDPLGAFAKTGVSPGPIKGHIAATAEAGVKLSAKTIFLASGLVVHEAGGTEAQEVAVMAACGFAYVKAAVAAGVDVSTAFGKIALGLSIDADYFMGVAKLRAARAVWARIKTASGGGSATAFVEARSSRRMLSTLDPWVNMLRLTSAAFGASIGGADAVVLDAFTQPLGRPTPFARRQSRNIQLVLMEEAHLGRVADPAGGAWYIETLTDRLARAAWALFQEIERRGGVVAALSSGFIAGEVETARRARSADVARRKTGVVGVSEFPNLAEAAVEVDVVNAASFAKAPSAVLPGSNSACPPLQPWRISAEFEDLRRRAKGMSGSPAAFLATIGAPRDYTGRVGFARNVMAVGGVDTVVGEVAAYKAVQTPIAVICGSDAGYAEQGVETAKALKAKGARRLYLAGRPGDLEAALRSAGVDDFVFVGSDIQSMLTGVLDHLGAGADA